MSKFTNTCTMNDHWKLEEKIKLDTTQIASLLWPTTLSSPVLQNTQSSVKMVILHHSVQSPEQNLHAGVVIHWAIPGEEGILNESRPPLILSKIKPLSRDKTTK